MYYSHNHQSLKLELDCPNCNELVGENVDVCFNCQYDFRLHKVPNAQERQMNLLAQLEQREREKEYEAKIADFYRSLPKYEYRTEIVYDNSSGGINKDRVDYLLTKYSAEGWRLKFALTNELGKNSSSITFAGVTNGTNSTVDQTLLIFERLCFQPD